MSSAFKNKNERDFSEPAASDYNEEALVKGLSLKEDWAFRFLIDRWSGKLLQLTYRILGKKEDAEEMLSEVLQKIVERIADFKGESSLYTWIYRIAVNQSLMKLRTMKGKHFVSWEEFQPHFDNGMRILPVPDWAQIPEERFLKKELQDFLQQCVDELPEDLKTAYLLKDTEGLSEEAVCETLALTKPAMKNRVHRARLILRELLEKKYVC